MQKFIKVAMILISVLLVFGAAHGDLIEGLVAYYAFDGNAIDESGNGNNGIVYGATLASDRLGNPNSAYNFRGYGYNDFIQIPDSRSLNITGDMTITAWINTSNIDPYWSMEIFSNMEEVSPHNGYMLSVSWWDGDDQYEDPDNKTLRFMSGDASIWSNSAVNTGDWIHVAAILSGTHAEIYLNGILDNAGTVGVPTSFGADQFIGQSNSNYYNFDGLLDEIRIYNRALSKDEIQQIALIVPEPSTLLLLSFSLLGLLIGYRKKDN
ncbi:MAG: LamG domain-containing protein [Chitinispirillaceae bacterium]|nr:LamG domain-containing protein [Chitinispirillaceae bacterium]